MKILVTGFDPFGGESINPALEVIKRLPKEILGAEIITLEIPTVAYKSLDCIETAIQMHNPDVILSIGQAGGRAQITVERVGININDFSIPDNEGNQMVDEPMFEAAPAAYFTTVPIKAMVARIKEAGLLAAVSNTAGTFVCNHVTFGTRHLIEEKYPNRKSGFIHIPFLPEQTVGREQFPSMELELILQGIVLAIEAIVIHSEDVRGLSESTH